MSSRPRLTVFLWIGFALVLGWLTFVIYQVMKYIEIEEMTMRSVGLPTLAGLAAILGVVALLYGAVWSGKAVLQWANPVAGPRIRLSSGSCRHCNSRSTQPRMASSSTTELIDSRVCAAGGGPD